MINVQEVCKSFDETLILDRINVSVQSGEFVSLLGPSGCGKSTLLRIVAGLEQPSQGRVQMGLEHTAETARDSVDLAFVFQEPNLLPWRRVWSNIALPLRLRGALSQQATAERVTESLRRVGLSERDARKLPKQLSGGMKMRVSLARALVTHPDVMLMDEPFGALDELLRQQLNEDVLRLWREQQWTVMFVTHHVAEAVFLSQRVLIMGAHPGRLIADIQVPFDYPRSHELRSSVEFARLSAKVSDALRGAMK